MKVLIADDERTLVNMLKEILRQNKIDCDIVFNGSDAVDYACASVRENGYAKTSNYDLIVLDIMMPKMNGIDALKEIRKNKVSTPILMLSAKSEVMDKVDGLNFGADDYLTKPFATNELLARIKALTRRKSEYTGDILAFGDLELDKDTFVLKCEKQEIKLSATEYKIMELLLQSPKKIVNKERLIEKVWGWDNNAEYNNAEVYISFLRKKLAALNSKTIIKAVRGIGYSLECAQ